MIQSPEWIDCHGVRLKIRLEYDCDITLFGKATQVVADFPSPITGGCRHRNVYLALQSFRDPNKIDPSRELVVPCLAETRDDATGAWLNVSVSADDGVWVQIERAEHIKPQAILDFRLRPSDPGYDKTLERSFANLVWAMNEDNRQLAQR
ncbi:hypothetical protein HY440_02595 [Candidatus Microgenomates bacterium]|nr:hypothetical protein [Candidatus Microgenomates bacterium]